MGDKNIWEKIVYFFDKLEDKVRGRLSRKPILYALVGGIGIVLFWKGVWETAEYFDFLYGPGSIIASLIILLLVGLFVSYFIGDSIVISGLRGEKKIIDKEEHEIFNEEQEIARLADEMKVVHRELHELKNGSEIGDHNEEIEVVRIPVKKVRKNSKKQV